MQGWFLGLGSGVRIWVSGCRVALKNKVGFLTSATHSKGYRELYWDHIGISTGLGPIMGTLEESYDSHRVLIWRGLGLYTSPIISLPKP